MGVVKLLLKIISVLLLLFNGIGAVYGSWHLITDPTGESIKMPLSLLQYSTFKNFFIPGIVLFVANGLISFVAVGFLNKKSYPVAVAVQGCILFGWICVQVIMLRSIWALHIVCGLVGLCLIGIVFCLRKFNKPV